MRIVRAAGSAQAPIPVWHLIARLLPRSSSCRRFFVAALARVISEKMFHFGKTTALRS
jgi:hypothetical protein